MTKVYIGLGSNLGDREQNLRAALEKIQEQIGDVVSLSAFYVTRPCGFVSANDFLNAAACIETGLPPMDVLLRTQAIERELGRQRKSVDGVYTDRPIDIDLLLYADLVLSAVSPSGVRLELPHPLMTERDFVMRPLAEIAPDAVHPISGKTMRQILAGLNSD